MYRVTICSSVRVSNASLPSRVASCSLGSATHCPLGRVSSDLTSRRKPHRPAVKRHARQSADLILIGWQPHRALNLADGTRRIPARPRSVDAASALARLQHSRPTGS